MNNSDISIVLLLYQTPKKLLKNLEKYKNYKIYILDQGNDKIIQKWIKKNFKRIQYLGSFDKNIGFAKGINFLVKKINTKYFLCTQADVLIQSKSINLLKKVISNNKKCVISIPRINTYNNKKDIIKVDKFYGGIFMAEKSKFVKMKMFDENFFFYWEDVDLSNRIKKSNYEILQSYKAKATHTYGSSSVFSIKNQFIRSSNFKFGEFLFQYKNNKLRLVKVLRQLITYLFTPPFFLIILKPIKALKNFCYFIGIVKFLLFRL